MLDASLSYIHLDDRFADRDMLVRYHWGLGIGHVYSHEDSKFHQSPAMPDCEADGPNELEDEDSADRQHQTPSLTPRRDTDDSGFENEDSDDPELGVDIRDSDDFSDQSSSDSESLEQNCDGENEAESDEEHLELMDSYYTNY